jgi:DNA-binding transcriptional ArsR family regulator
VTGPLELSDPRALRAYAHPTRLALLGLLRREGPKTATEAAPLVGESVASCSFHLRQLARYGLVEEVEGGRGRARPWRATALSTTWPTDSDDPATAAAAARLELLILDRHFQQARAWVDRRDKESTAWRRAGSTNDYLLHLTAAETRRLTERVEAIIDEFAPRLTDPGLRPRGSRPVRLIYLAFPNENTPGEAAGESAPGEASGETTPGASPPPQTRPRAGTSGTENKRSDRVRANDERANDRRANDERVMAAAPRDLTGTRPSTRS